MQTQALIHQQKDLKEDKMNIVGILELLKYRCSIPSAY